MNWFKDKKIVALVVVLVIFTFIYFISVGKISHAFETTNYSKEAYNSLIKTIKTCSEEYAKKNDNIFNEENVAYIKIQDLIDANFLATNNGDNIVSPLDGQTILNSNIVKIKKDNNNYQVEID